MDLTNTDDMKLYAFQPTGHGQTSFFIMAEDEFDAKYVVSKYINHHYRHPDGSLMYSAQGWGTNDYVMTVADELEIIENDND